MTPKSPKAAERRANLPETTSSVSAPRGYEAGAGLREDPYRLILDELYRKRQEIESAIWAIEQVASGAHGPMPDAAPPKAPAAEEAHQPISAALLAVLRDLGGSARNGEMKAALTRSGYRFRGDPTVSVAQCLIRLANAGMVTKLDRGVWKLRSSADKLRL